MSVLVADRHTAKSEFEHTFSLFYADSERLLNKVSKRRKEFICTNIILLNNSIYDDIMTIQNYLFSKKEYKKEIKQLKIQDVFKKIEYLERCIMVYSNIMSLPFEKQGNWCSSLDKEIALLNGMVDDKHKKSKFRVSVLDWNKINKFETLRNMSKLHRYTHGKAVRAVGELKNGETSLLINLIDEAFYCLMKANSYIPQTKEEYEERTKYIETSLLKLNEIQRPMLLYFNTMKYSNRVQMEWSEMLNLEIKLIKGLLKSDKKRFSKLP